MLLKKWARTPLDTEHVDDCMGQRGNKHNRDKLGRTHSSQETIAQLVLHAPIPTEIQPASTASTISGVLFGGSFQLPGDLHPTKDRDFWGSVNVAHLPPHGEHLVNTWLSGEDGELRTRESDRRKLRRSPHAYIVVGLGGMDGTVHQWFFAGLLLSKQCVEAS